MSARSLCKPGEFAPQADATTVSRQAGAEYIRHVDEFAASAYRTIANDWHTDFAGCSHEFGMGVADLAAVEDPAAIVGQYRRASQPVVDKALGGPGGGRRYSKHSTPDARSHGSVAPGQSSCRQARSNSSCVDSDIGPVAK